MEEDCAQKTVTVEEELAPEDGERNPHNLNVMTETEKERTLAPSNEQTTDSTKEGSQSVNNHLCR